MSRVMDFTPKKTVSSRKPPGQRPERNERKITNKREIANRMVEFNQVINAIHINTHPAQKKLLKEITGGCDILSVRRWLITAHTEAVLK